MANTLLLIPLKLRSGAVHLPYRVSQVVTVSNAEPQLLQPEHREEKMPNISNRLVEALVVVLVLVLVAVVLPMTLVLVLVIFGFRIKTSDDLGMLLPLNLQRLLREAHKKATTANTYIYCYFYR